jgi:DNA-binding response OmpR family regulator
MLKMVESHLQSAGYQVRTAPDGFGGVTETRAWKPDLVLLDVMMPRLDGLTTCRRIRDFAAVPIIIVTAKGSESDIVKGLNAGADDYVVKPYSAHELLARVRAVLRRSDLEGLEPYEHQVFERDNLHIDVDRAHVRVDGEQVPLTATEFKLLTTLAANMGEVLSSRELLTSVWGRDYGTDKAILWVTLSRLRQKIEADPKNPVHIVTKQGIGYMMPQPGQEN